MLVATEGDQALARRNRAILRLLWDLGLRRGELVGLDLEHVDLAAGTVSVPGKGRSGREPLALPPETTAALGAWIGVRGNTPCPPGVMAATGFATDRSVLRSGPRAWPFLAFAFGRRTRVRRERKCAAGAVRPAAGQRR